MWKSFVVALGVLAVVLGGCRRFATPPPGEAGRDAVKLGVGYIPSVQFAPFYVGLEKGFFAEEGIDLELAHGFENDYLKLVGVGEIPFMIGSGDQIVLGRAQGLPVRYVANWYSRYPVTVFAKQEQGITKPADLKGKKSASPAPSARTMSPSAASWRAPG